ncbi:hypothetical protein OS145_07531 [Idiomarina baltica OS145]|uniref:Uncharacterized protein n=1 Tax=Idiomarina baltica OS145 TaxID=314276 RepID=A0ABM9WIP4_9GAMM|nr:hypothetical protein OS145_07531 [Idiomarina baltica OS145]
MGCGALRNILIFVILPMTQASKDEIMRALF